MRGHSSKPRTQHRSKKAPSLHQRRRSSVSRVLSTVLVSRQADPQLNPFVRTASTKSCSRSYPPPALRISRPALLHAASLPRSSSAGAAIGDAPAAKWTSGSGHTGLRRRRPVARGTTTSPRRTGGQHAGDRRGPGAGRRHGWTPPVGGCGLAGPGVAPAPGLCPPHPRRGSTRRLLNNCVSSRSRGAGPGRSVGAGSRAGSAGVA